MLHINHAREPHVNQDSHTECCTLTVHRSHTLIYIPSQWMLHINRAQEPHINLDSFTLNAALHGNVATENCMKCCISPKDEPPKWNSSLLDILQNCPDLQFWQRCVGNDFNLTCSPSAQVFVCKLRHCNSVWVQSVTFRVKSGFWAAISCVMRRKAPTPGVALSLYNSEGAGPSGVSRVGNEIEMALSIWSMKGVERQAHKRQEKFPLCSSICFLKWWNCFYGMNNQNWKRGPFFSLPTVCLIVKISLKWEDIVKIFCINGSTLMCSLSLTVILHVSERKMCLSRVFRREHQTTGKLGATVQLKIQQLRVLNYTAEFQSICHSIPVKPLGNSYYVILCNFTALYDFGGGTHVQN